jgi:hypothetical protein
MKRHRTHLGQRAGLLLAAIALGFCGAAAAGEKGRFKGHAALVVTKNETIKVEDQPEHVIYQMQEDGVMFNDAGSGLLDKARYQVIYMSDSGGMVSGGYKTFTMADGSKVYAKFADTEANPPVYKGTWEFTGGSGKYAGIKGKGVWTYTSVADGVAWDVFEGDYEMP